MGKFSKQIILFNNHRPVTILEEHVMSLNNSKREKKETKGNLCSLFNPLPQIYNKNRVRKPPYVVERLTPTSFRFLEVAQCRAESLLEFAALISAPAESKN